MDENEIQEQEITLGEEEAQDVTPVDDDTDKETDDKPADEQETEDEPKGDEQPTDEDEYTDDISEYLSQHPELEGVESVEDLVELAIQGKQPVVDERIAKIEGILRSQGFHGTVDDYLNGTGTVQSSGSQQNDNTQDQPFFDTVGSGIQQAISEGRLYDEDGQISAVTGVIDTAMQANNQKTEALFRDLYSKIDALGGSTKKALGFVQGTEYAEYSKQFSEGAVAKTELDKVIKDNPKFNYSQAHAYWVAENPERFAKFLDKYKNNSNQQEAKKKKFKGKFKTLSGKGGSKTDSNLGNYDSYFDGGQHNPKYFKLSPEDQDRVDDMAIAAHDR